MIKETAAITTEEMAGIIGQPHDAVIMAVKIMLLGLRGDMKTTEFSHPDGLLLPYKYALLTAAAWCPENMLKIVEALEAK